MLCWEFATKQIWQCSVFKSRNSSRWFILVYCRKSQENFIKNSNLVILFTCSFLYFLNKLWKKIPSWVNHVLFYNTSNLSRAHQISSDGIVSLTYWYLCILPSKKKKIQTMSCTTLIEWIIKSWVNVQSREKDKPHSELSVDY